MLSDTHQRPDINTNMIEGRNVAVLGGTFVQNISQEPTALDLLHGQCSLNALVNADARYDPPRCSASTRTTIIQKIEDWVNEDTTDTVPSSVFWLYGGAGAGKSAIAQTLAEKFQKNGSLAASFFFFRTDNSRNEGRRLIPTLALQLVYALPHLGPLVERAISTYRDVFSKNIETQMLQLIIEPLIRLSLDIPPESISHPRLIVIDGLDECSDPKVQCNLLHVIAKAIPHIPYPLRFLITSRPESDIVHTFNYDRRVKVIKVHRYDLSKDSNAHKDIRLFLKREFQEIRRVHLLKEHLPAGWPGRDAIDTLIDRSSGHFIYASTVIKYIQSRRHRPDERLYVVLGLSQPPHKERPYAQLDTLYTFIFRSVEDLEQLEQIRHVLGILYLRQTLQEGYFNNQENSDREDIEELLGMKPGDLELLLDPLLSLIAIDRGIQIYHKSLFDYLLDESRSGDLYLDLSVYHEIIANHIMKRIQERNCVALSNFRNLAYHCQFARLNDDLRGFMRSQDILWTSSSYYWEMFCSGTSMDWMGYFLQVMRRDDFDCQGECHTKYVKFWKSQGRVWKLAKNEFKAELKPLSRATLRERLKNLLASLGKREANNLLSDTYQRRGRPASYSLPTRSPSVGIIHNVIVFGEYSSVNSSVVNMLVGRDVVAVRTRQTKAYEVRVHDFTYRIHDTPGLNDHNSIDKIFMYIHRLDGVSLFIYSTDGRGSMTTSPLFYKFICGQQVPVIVTLENSAVRVGSIKEELRNHRIEPKAIVNVAPTWGRHESHYQESRRRLQNAIKDSLPHTPWSKDSKDQWFATIYNNPRTRRTKASRYFGYAVV